MFSRQRSQPAPIDLLTVRETLLYMQDDMRRRPDLRRAGEFLQAAIGELDAAISREDAPQPQTVLARFLPLRTATGAE